MIRLAKRIVKYGLKKAKYKIVRDDGVDIALPVEFTQKDAEIFSYIMSNRLTMVPAPALINTIQAAKYAVQHDIAGDFVECGVWRGGNALAAKMIFEAYGSDKTVWLFDTFAGMTAPDDRDVKTDNGRSAKFMFDESQRQGFNEWCYASLEDVTDNFRKSKVDIGNVRFIKGDVLETLDNTDNLPQMIAVLRLDTDWYQSTKKELETLYPRLVRRGIIILDDYAFWDGQRKAFEEYFENRATERPFMQVVYTEGCRAGVKH